MDEMKQLKQEQQPSIVELLREIRDDIRLMRQAMEAKKPYETKVEKPVIRYKGINSRTPVQWRCLKRRMVNDPF
jgi:hypothetical protein